ncbi:alpha/beta hydrolase-fold protein, partial [Lentimicrobium sp.]|uniref:alpha/beta hydrolase-fold protein n=1 Tax=Lentimicrobium sp. TaxID=2034841 RepID=UPI00345E9795
MKKQTIILAVLIFVFFFPIFLKAQFIKVNTEFYSNALKETRKVSIYLPHDYFQEQETHYPVVYFLHGWGGNQNALDDHQMLMSQLLLTGQIQPMIIVCAD